MLAIRWILTAFLITGAWIETGPFTGTCLVLIALSGELIAWIARDELRRIGAERAETWRREREANRKQ
jgi:hypothetical protein